MEFKPLSHESFLGSLNELDVWLSSKGVPPRRTDRIHQLVLVLRKYNPRTLGQAVTMIREEQRRYLFSLAELLEFQQISVYLHEEDRGVIGPKLIRALSGATDPASEDVKNSVGRNTTFELSLAAEWRRAGLCVHIGEPDIQLRVGNQEFLVECKRPFAWSSIARSLRDAKSQLRRNGATIQSGAPKGVIVLSLNRVMVAGRDTFFAESLEDKAELSEIINHELEANRWRWYDKIQFDESIAAVAFHLNVPAHINDGPQFALMSSLNTYKASANDEALAVFAKAMSYGSLETAVGG